MPVNRNEIVQTNVARVTISSVADLIACPRKFEDTRVSRNWDDAPNDNVEHGKALHAVMRDLYARRSGGEVPLEHLGVVVDRAVRRGKYSPDLDRARERQRLRTKARALTESDDYDDIEGTIGLESYIEYDLYHQGRLLVKISARLDRVLVRGTEQRTLVVRDYKSGAMRVDLMEVYVMLRAAKHKWPDFDRYVLEIDALDGEERVVRETVDYAECRDQHDLFRARAVEVLLRGYDHNDWPACPSDRCTYCRLRQSCQGLPADDIDNF